MASTSGYNGNDIDAYTQHVISRRPGAAPSSNYVGDGPTDPDVNGRNAPPPTSKNTYAIGDFVRAQTPEMPGGPAPRTPLGLEGPGYSYSETTPNVPADTGGGLPRGIRSGADTAAANYGTGSVRNPSGNGEFAQDGKRYTVTPTRQDGIKRVDAKGTSPLYTNIDPGAAVQGLAGVNSGAPAFSGVNLKADNDSMARTNAIRQSMIDSQPAGARGAGGYAGGVIPDARSMETQQLFDKWANEAMSKQLMSVPGGAQAAAGMYNQRSQNQAHLAGIDMTGRNQMGIAQMQGQNQLAGIAMTGRNQLENTGLQAQGALNVENTRGAYNLGGHALDAQGRQDTQKLATTGALEVGKQQQQSAMEVAKMQGDNRHLDSIPKMLETMPTKSEEYKELMGLYKGLLIPHLRSQAAAAQGQGPVFSNPGEVQAALKAGTIKSGQTVMTSNGPLQVH